MKMKLLAWAFGVGAVVAMSTPALAVIDNSHHDMTSVLGAAAESKCYYCHGIPQAIPAAAVTTYGNVGGFCVVRCHSSAGLASAAAGEIPTGPLMLDVAGAQTTPLADPTTLSPGGGSHPVSYDDGNVVITGMNAPDTAATGIDTLSWPYANDAGGIQCTTCHSVHDNDEAFPFLWADLNPQSSIGTTSATDAASSFCQQCHNGRSGITGDLSTAAFGDHPVEVVFNTATAAGRATGTDNGRRGRTMSMNETIFNVVYGSDSATSGNDFDVVDNHYQTGGHAGDGVGALAATDTIGCYTCHSAHAAGGAQLTLAPQTGNVESVLCVNCHGPGPTPAAGTSKSNPGVSPYYHPVGAEAPSSDGGTTYTSSNGTFPIVIANPVGLQLGLTNDELLCNSCHDVHAGNAGDMALQDFGQGANLICNQCHQGGEGSNAGANAHHITFTTGNAPNNWSGGDTPGTWMDGVNQTMADGLDCADCHVFNNTAHNW